MAKQSPPSTLCSRWVLAWSLPLVFVLPSACGKADTTVSDGPDLPSGVFGGGASGIKEPILAGMSSVGRAGGSGTVGGASNALPDPCAAVPAGVRALIDDFEDGDSAAVPETDREAYWFTIHDDSTGSIVPEDFLPVPGGAHRSAYSAHVAASGYSIWGAAFSSNISHLADGIRCPFNASRFSGLRFFARGSGQARVNLQIPEVVDELYSGSCRSSQGEVCYDTHGIWITLRPQWQAYSIKWAELVQRGFGKQLPFRPGAIMSVQFSFETAELPVDAWLDDIAWEDGSPVPDPGSGAAGATGEGGASAEGGTSAEGGASADGGASAEGGAGGAAP
jgi:hypothetical protein